ncbi:hypothetical protein KDH_28590 [Dictyobacter sp. S3.2.2.5]|uniref:Major facilitator superfamily (MFS) profile domain-containing protein n=1 Tax=Dictyobacter halimunensis TaxID=3026934 RepID=A0ABQ6FQP5_9CHLR|nr:hypothetical protein KDH_28590 [Dictyobacter sp. S3.2.2.5]
MNRALQRGATSGLLAGLILGVLFFVDYGPGAALVRAASWFGLGQLGGSKWLGFLILIVMGGLFGLLFGALQRNRTPELGRLLLQGLTMGIVWWVIVVFLIGTGLYHVRLDLSGSLYAFGMLLLYGVLLGSLFFQRSTVQVK